MPKIVNREQFQSELLLNCFDLFARRGFNTTTMRQIAQELGISTGTLYHYFPSKEILFNQLFLVVSQRDEIQVLESMIDLESLEDRLTALADFIEKNEAYFQHILFLLFDYYQRHPSDQNDDEFVHKAAKWYRDLITQVVGGDDPNLGIFVFGAFNGLMIQRIMSGKAISIKEQSGLLIDLITTYLSNKQKVA